MALLGDFFGTTFGCVPTGNWNWPRGIAVLGEDVYFITQDVWTEGADNGNFKFYSDESYALVLFKVTNSGVYRMTGGAESFAWDAWAARGGGRPYAWDAEDLDRDMPDGFGPNTAIGWEGYSGNSPSMVSDDERYLYISVVENQVIRRFDTQTYQLDTILGHGLYGVDSTVISPGFGRSAKLPANIGSLGYDPDRRELWFWANGRLEGEGAWPLYPYRLCKLKVDPPFEMTVEWSQSDSSYFLGHLYTASQEAWGYGGEWLRQIGVNGLPNSLNEEVLVVPSQSITMDYHDGYMYMWEGESGVSVRFDRTTLAANYEGKTYSLRRFDVTNPTKFEVLYYNIGKLETLEHAWNSHSRLQHDVYSVGGEWRVRVKDQTAYALWENLVVGDRFHYDGPIEITSVGASGATADLIQCDGSRVPVDLGPDIGPQSYNDQDHNWTYQGLKRSTGVIPYQFVVDGWRGLDIIGDGRLIAFRVWQYGGLVSGTNRGGGNTTGYNQICTLDLPYLLANKPVQHSVNNPPDCFRVATFPQPAPLPRRPWGTPQDFLRDGRTVCHWWVPTFGISTGKTPGSRFWEKIVYAHPMGYFGWNNPDWKGSSNLIRVLSDQEATEQQNRNPIDFEMAFEAPAMIAYQAKRPLSRSIDLGRLILS